MGPAIARRSVSVAEDGRSGGSEDGVRRLVRRSERTQRGSRRTHDRHERRQQDGRPKSARCGQAALSLVEHWRAHRDVHAVPAIAGVCRARITLDIAPGGRRPLGAAPDSGLDRHVTVWRHAQHGPGGDGREPGEHRQNEVTVRQDVE